jgi:hypothetical protein
VNRTASRVAARDGSLQIVCDPEFSIYDFDPMGILKHLLLWPVTGPTFLTRFSLEKLDDTVRYELTDDQRIKDDLMALQLELEMGEITDDEYVDREADLMQQLREVRRWREEFGMGTGGGPVRVAGSGRGPEPEPGAPDEPRSPGIASPEGAEIEFPSDEETTS